MSSVPVDVGSIGTLFCQVNNFFRLFVDLFVRLPKSSISVGALTHLRVFTESAKWQVLRVYDDFDVFLLVVSPLEGWQNAESGVNTSA